MKFYELALYFQKLEEISSRNTMTEVLAQLFEKAEIGEIDKICYLLQGRVAPLYEAREFGMAEKMVLKAMAAGTGVGVEEVRKEFKKAGDLGKTIEKLKVKSIRQAQDKSEKLKVSIQNSKLSVNQVFEVLYKVAMTTGVGSVEIKINLLGDLLREIDPLSARYIVRIPVNKMRLGFSDMTILDALSWMLSKSKNERKEIEKAYNVRPDLGFIASAIKEKGIRGLLNVKPVVGTPILMARAERLSSGVEIIEKIGRCGVEPKIDGFRIQCHYKAGGFKSCGLRVAGSNKTDKQEMFDFVPNEKGVQKVRLFTRNLEEVTFMYPDIVAGIEKQINGDEVIFEGEAIAFNPRSGEYLSFQETVQRKRKYNIESIKKEIPLRLICFELLFKDKTNMTYKTYRERRKEMEKTIKRGETLLLAEQQEVEDPEKLEEIFQNAIGKGLEGVMAKKLDGVYQAGMRGWNWIKYKKSYDSKIDDTVDAVVLGYDFGQGKRTGFGIGAFLIGVYDKLTDTFKTIAKIGTGLTDEEWRTLKVQSSKFKVQSKPIRYDVDKMMECDVWVEPKIMVIIKADEITRSPVHTAGREMQKTKSGALRQASFGKTQDKHGKVAAMEVKTPGYALRFPRLVNFRDDKSVEDATSMEEIEEMYKLQSQNSKVKSQNHK